MPKLKLDGTLQSKIGGVLLNSDVGKDTKIFPFTSNVDVILSLLDKTKFVAVFVVISGILSCLLFVKFVMFDVLVFIEFVLVVILLVFVFTVLVRDVIFDVLVFIEFVLVFIEFVLVFTVFVKFVIFVDDIFQLVVIETAPMSPPIKFIVSALDPLPSTFSRPTPAKMLLFKICSSTSGILPKAKFPTIEASPFTCNVVVVKFELALILVAVTSINCKEFTVRSTLPDPLNDFDII